MYDSERSSFKVEVRMLNQRIAELEAALARADEMLIQREQAYTQKAEWYEQALQEQQAKVERLEEAEKHLDMLKFFCDSLIGTSMEHPRSPKIWTIVMTPALENLKSFLALQEDG